MFYELSLGMGMRHGYECHSSWETGDEGLLYVYIYIYIYVCIYIYIYIYTLLLSERGAPAVPADRGPLPRGASGGPSIQGLGASGGGGAVGAQS